MGTKPAIARVLGLAPPSHPQSLERERPLSPDQTTIAHVPTGDGENAQGRGWSGDHAAGSAGLAGAGHDAARSGAGTHLAVIRARAAGFSDWTRQAARDRRILHCAPRLGSGNNPDSGRGAWNDLAAGQNVIARRVAGSGRATASPRTSGLGGLAHGSHHRAPPAPLGTVDTRTIPCLSRCRRMAGPECRG